MRALFSSPRSTGTARRSASRNGLFGEPGYALSVVCRHRSSAVVDAVIRQIRLPLSSETSSAPSGATVTPTGRPHC